MFHEVINIIAPYAGRTKAKKILGSIPKVRIILSKSLFFFGAVNEK